MNIILDIMGSLFLGGMLLINSIQVSSTVTDTNFQNTLDVITQENSSTIAQLIQDDFYKVGYNLTKSPDLPIILADTDRVTFRSDIDQNGNVDTVRYYTTPIETSGARGSYKFKALYRDVNGKGGRGMRVGITDFKFTYYDRGGHLIVFPSATDTTSLASIRSIKVQMMVRNPYAVDPSTAATLDTTFAAMYWEKFISPKNLRLVK